MMLQQHVVHDFVLTKNFVDMICYKKFQHQFIEKFLVIGTPFLLPPEVNRKGFPLQILYDYIDFLHFQ